MSVSYTYTDAAQAREIVSDGSLVRAFVPTADQLPAPAVEEDYLQLFGLSLLNVTQATALDILFQDFETPKRVAFVNAHCVNMMQGDRAYRSALDEASYLLPDGSGVGLAARLTDQHMVDNLNGTDLFPPLCERAAQEGKSVFLLGARPGIAEAAGKEMQSRYPNLEIAGCRDGYFQPEQQSDVVDEINQSGADILLVAMGVPYQEKWISRWSAVLKPKLVLGVGGLFDYYSGRIPRAPLWMRKAGSEWVWRLMQEPRRMAGRYLLGNPLFVCRSLKERFVLKSGLAQIEAYDISKRLIDAGLASMALLVLSPLLMMIALAIKLTSQGPVFFVQSRVGKNGALFPMIKFRSMYVDAEARRQALLASSDRDSVCFKMKNDPRVTWAGRWLRRTSLDEIPQLFNVVRGEMSLVGPRPALQSEVAHYSDREEKRLNGMPGITGIWQIAGRAEIGFEKQVEMDIAYLKTRSTLLDLGILAFTVPAVVLGRGAY